jgi:hypothetical protein
MSKRILVLEDQPDNHQIIRDMLALPTMRSPRPRTVRGVSGHGVDSPQCRLLTQTGHAIADFAVVHMAVCPC